MVDGAVRFVQVCRAILPNRQQPVRQAHALLPTHSVEALPHCLGDGHCDTRPYNCPWEML